MCIYRVIRIHVPRHVVLIVSIVAYSLSLSTMIKVEAIAGGVVGGSAGLAIAALVTYAIAVLIAVLCCSSCEGRSEIEM